MPGFLEILANGAGGAGAGTGGSSLNASYQSGKSSTTGSSSGTTTTRAFDATAKTQLDQLTAMLLGKTTQGPDAAFSKEAAQADSRATVEQIFKDFKRSTLPNILSLQGQSGTYSNTAVAGMANDAFAQTIGKAGALVLDTIGKYAGIQQQGEQLDTASLLGALQLQRDAFNVQDFTQAATSRSKSKNIGASIGLKF